MINRIDRALRSIRYKLILWLAGDDAIVINARFVGGTFFINCDKNALVASSEFIRTVSKTELHTLAQLHGEVSPDVAH